MISHIMINNCIDFHVVKKTKQKQYPMVVLEFNVKLRVAFLFVLGCGI